jgi:Xaa-Pro aminopeptidase
MTPEEIGWLDAYHERVRETLSPLVDERTRAWLEAATRPTSPEGRGGPRFG